MITFYMPFSISKIDIIAITLCIAIMISIFRLVNFDNLISKLILKKD